MTLVSRLSLSADTWPDDDLCLKRFSRWHVHGKLPKGRSAAFDVAVRLVAHAMSWGDNAANQVANGEKKLIEEDVRRSTDAEIVQAAFALVPGLQAVASGGFSVHWQQAPWAPRRVGEQRVAIGTKDVKKMLIDAGHSAIDVAMEQARRSHKAANQQTPSASKKRNRACPPPGDTLVAPLSVARADVSRWRAKILRASKAESRTDVDADVAGVCRGKDDWKERLLKEVERMDKLMTATKNEGSIDAAGVFRLIGHTDDGSSGRTLTHYPQINKGAWQFVQTLAAASRKELFKTYASVDLSSAHLHVAWSAVVLAHGCEEAARLAPCLRLCVEDRDTARRRVAEETGRSVADSKREILKSLNQLPAEGSRGTDFLASLRREREVWVPALVAMPASKRDGDPSSKKSKADPAVRESSILLQTIEDRCIRIIVSAVASNGWETGAIVADGLLVRPGPSAGPGRIDDLLHVAEEAVNSELGVAVRLGVEWEARV